MTNLLHGFLLLSCSILVLDCTAKEDNPEPYIVYMGSSSVSNMDESIEDLEAPHLQLLSTVVPSEEKERLFLIHSYSHAMKGFSAMLSKKEATVLSGHDGVVSVFKDPILPLHTTRSWDFLEAESGNRKIRHEQPQVSGDTIIGIIDTGIWPESQSFDDHGMSEIPARWKGVCMEGSDFKKSDCNRKLIGARHYVTNVNPPQQNSNTSTTAVNPTGSSPRDTVGHGTHTASTAAGTPTPNASYYGLAPGTAHGGSPSSRLAIYKACSLGGCAGSNILKAIDDAVHDGVDVVSISIGTSSAFQEDFLSDPIAIGALHADENGVMVVCSGGNDGPEAFTVVNSAPWIVTVAASTIDRGFESDVVLGNGVVVKGSAINFSNLTRSKPRPLVFGGDVAGEFTPAFEASNCYPGSLDTEKTAGKIIVCIDTDPSVSKRVKKLVAQSSGAIGAIVVDGVRREGSVFDSGTFPFTAVDNKAGDLILKYINSTKLAKATILPSQNVYNVKPSPMVAIFSSRGPGGLTESILKPDVMAPGVGILAASIPVADDDVPSGSKHSMFAIKSGTSMASPHVAGAAALVKAAHPKWTPSMIRSALMTTSSTTNNLESPLKTTTGTKTTWHETGAGEISPTGALNPGLVFQTTTQDYLHFLCHHGYPSKVVSELSNLNFTCPANSSDNLISNLNYPSISIARLDSRKRSTVTVTRTVTNVGGVNSTYDVAVDAPVGLVVEVVPKRLVFSDRNNKATFKVSFGAKNGTKGYMFGSVVWTDSRHLVRLIFAVNVV